MPSTLTITAEHPALPGHFPGNHIVPGVVILQHVIETATSEGYTVNGVANAKFSAPLLPGQSCQINFEPKGSRLQFEVVLMQEVVVQGTLVVEPQVA